MRPMQHLCLEMEEPEVIKRTATNNRLFIHRLLSINNRMAIQILPTLKSRTVQIIRRWRTHTVHTINRLWTLTKRKLHQIYRIIMQAAPQVYRTVFPFRIFQLAATMPSTIQGNWERDRIYSHFLCTMRLPFSSTPFVSICLIFCFFLIFFRNTKDSYLSCLITQNELNWFLKFNHKY